MFQLPVLQISDTHTVSIKINLFIGYALILRFAQHDDVFIWRKFRRKSLNLNLCNNPYNLQSLPEIGQEKEPLN